MSGTTGGGAIAPLNIELKEDSPEVLAAVAGKPTKYYLSASEFEILRAFVNAYAEAANDALTINAAQQLILDAHILRLSNIPTTFAPANATVNSTDAQLKDRANHTGTQLASTISDFKEKVLENLVNRSQVLSKRVTAGAFLTASTVETILDTIVIPANTFSGSGLMWFDAILSANNTLIKTVKISISNTNSLSGATVLMTTGGVNLLSFVLSKTFNVVPTGIQYQLNTQVDAGATVQKSVVALNFTQPIYLFVTMQLGATNVGFGGNIDSHSLIIV